MATGSAQRERATALPSAPVSGTAGELPLRRISTRSGRLRAGRTDAVWPPVAGGIALVLMVACASALVLFASAGPSILVTRSSELFPGWQAGPLHLVSHGLATNNLQALYDGFSALLVVMLIAYGVVLACVRATPMRVLVSGVVALHVILLMCPPLQLNDVFNYLGYARLGTLHGLNPYTHVIAAEAHDPVYRWSTWHHLHSPYGPLFTAASYLLPLASLSLSYWLLKIVTTMASLAFLAVVCQCARRLERDPRFALAFVALNPVYLVWAVGGFHNDFFMLLPSMGAILLVLGRRDRWAGGVLMLAVAVKFTAVLLLPFLLVAVRGDWIRVRRIMEGAVAAAVPLAGLSIALFGLALPNLQAQSTLLTWFSIPNVVGLVLGIGGGTAPLLRALDVAVVAVILVLLRRRGDWLSHAGWATLALLASLAWLMPWYGIWVVPLAALGSSVRLRRATLAFTVFVVLTFLPAVKLYMANHRIDPLATPAGKASEKLQHKLS